MPHGRQKSLGRRLIPRNRSSLEAKLAANTAVEDCAAREVRIGDAPFLNPVASLPAPVQPSVPDSASNAAGSMKGGDEFAAMAAVSAPDDPDETLQLKTNAVRNHDISNDDDFDVAESKQSRERTVIPLSKDSLAHRSSKEEPSFGAVGMVRSPGDSLREARKAKSLSVQDVADQLNLKNDVVEALEQDRAEEVAGLTYARGYQKTYARFLKIDSELIASWHQDAENSAAEKPSKLSSARPSVTNNDRSSGLGTMMMVLMAVVVGSGIWFGYKQDWFSGAIANNPGSDADRVRLGPEGDRPDSVLNMDSDAVADGTAGTDSQNNQITVEDTAVIEKPQTDTDQQAVQVISAKNNQEISFDSDAANTAQPVSAPVTTQIEPSSQAPAADATAQNAPQTDSTESILQPIEGEQSSSTVVSEVQKNSTEISSETDGYRSIATAAVSGGEATVTLRGKSDSWVEVSDATGKKIFLDMVHTNETYNVSGKPPLRLLIGNAPGVDVEFEGSWIDVMGNTNDNNVARLILGENSG